MAKRRRLHGPRPAVAAALPPPTIRLRMTLLYGPVFLVTGAVLLTIGYALVRHNLERPVATAARACSELAICRRTSPAAGRRATRLDRRAVADAIRPARGRRAAPAARSSTWSRSAR